MSPESHARQRAALTDRVRRDFSTAWARVDPRAVRASWLAEIPRLLVTLTIAQQVAAASADAYVAAAVGSPAVRELVLGAFSHVASDGRALDSLLERPAAATIRALQLGDPLDRSMAAGALTAQLIGHTQVADAGRVADLTALTANPAANGYVRLLVGRTCARCMVLAGRRYSWKADFKRHPRCFPAGVVSSGPGLEAASRRWYLGELVVITTAEGHELPLTGNHPVLTDRGWLPAHFIQEGDHVVRSTRGHGATALTIPNEDHVPSLIEDLWSADGMGGLVRVPTAPEDFHGDGGHGDVDVVFPDRLLRDRAEPRDSQPFEHAGLSSGLDLTGGLDSERALLQFSKRMHPASIPVMGRLDLGQSRSGGHLCRSDQSGLGPSSDFDFLLKQAAPDRGARYSVPDSELEFALSAQIQVGQLAYGQSAPAGSRWDAPSGARSAENTGAYASRGLDLLGRLAGQVELDRVIDVRRAEWSGHVYSLTSSEGWHSANNLIVSNCDCTVVPAGAGVPFREPVSPQQAFREMLPSEQDKVFGKAGADAIRQGADIGQVVNARTGMYTASGRLMTTTGGGRRPRLMPEQILAEAKGDRVEAVRLLSLHGFIR